MIDTDVIHPNDFRAQTSQALLKRLWRDLRALAALDTELARKELSEKARVAGGALRVYGFAAAFAVAALMSLTICIIAAARTALGLPLAALILGALYAGVAVVLVAVAKRELSEVSLGTNSTLSRELFGWLETGNCRTLSTEELEDRIEQTHKRIDESVMALERKTDLLPPLRDTALSVGSLGAALAAVLRENNDGSRRRA